MISQTQLPKETPPNTLTPPYNTYTDLIQAGRLQSQAFELYQGLPTYHISPRIAARQASCRNRSGVELASEAYSFCPPERENCLQLICVGLVILIFFNGLVVFLLPHSHSPLVKATTWEGWCPMLHYRLTPSLIRLSFVCIC